MNFKAMLAVAILLVSVSCTKRDSQKSESTQQKILNIGVISKIKGFDPITANDRYTSNEVARVYEGLYEYHYLKRPFQLVPNLAQNMPEISPDGLTYTIKVKEKVFFQDNQCFPGGKGRELEAKDFIYSFQRVADPKLVGVGWWIFDGKIKGFNDWRDTQAKSEKTDYDQVIEGLTHTDKYTLKVVLTKPNPLFIYALAQPFAFVVPRECVEFYKEEFINNPVGTGPFITGKYAQQSRIEYLKNPTFRAKFYPTEADSRFASLGYLESAGKPLPLVDKLVVDIMVEENTRWLNFKKGNIDYLAPPKDNFNAAISKEQTISDEFKEKGVGLFVEPGLDVTFSAFNFHYKIFRDHPKLRQAMSLAADMDRTNQLFYNGTGIVAQSSVPPNIAGHDPTYKNPYQVYNLEAAKKLLKEAGFEGGKGVPEISYETSNSPTNRQIAEFFQRQMAELGIKIKIGLNPFPELQKKIRTREAMMIGMAWGADYPDAENFLQLFYGPNETPGSNHSNYNHPEFNKLYEEAITLPDSPARTALYEKMYRMIGDEVPWIFGVHRRYFILTQGWLKNYIYSDLEWGRGQYLDVDMAKKAELLKKY